MYVLRCRSCGDPPRQLSSTRGSPRFFSSCISQISPCLLRVYFLLCYTSSLYAQSRPCFLGGYLLLRFRRGSPQFRQFGGGLEDCMLHLRFRHLCEGLDFAVIWVARGNLLWSAGACLSCIRRGSYAGCCASLGLFLQVCVLPQGGTRSTTDYKDTDLDLHNIQLC